jgi:hypothetical protein
VAEPARRDALREDLARRVRWQAVACHELGSALYASLLDHVAADVLAGGASARVLAGHENDTGPSALALRLMGAVHRLVLDQRAPDLAMFYPSVGGTAELAGSWPAFRQVLVDHGAELRRELDRPPQTNEVGRPTHLSCWPIRGSAGHRLVSGRCTLSSGAGATRHRSIPRRRTAGCDSRRMCGPISRTASSGCVVRSRSRRRCRRRWCVSRLATSPRTLELAAGTTTVVWHSITWQFLDDRERSDVEARLDSLGGTANPQARLAHLSMEQRRRTPSSGHEVLVVLRMWPGGEERVLGSASAHGIPTTWD